MNHAGALEHQVDQSQYPLTSDLYSQSQQFATSLRKTPVDGDIPNDVPARENSLGLWKYLDDDSPCLGDNIVSNEKIFNITDFSPEWACSTEHTKVCPSLSCSTELSPFLVLLYLCMVIPFPTVQFDGNVPPCLHLIPVTKNIFSREV